MFWCPVEQGRQAPHAGMYEQTTWSPAFTRLHVGADRLDHAGALVPADHREPHRRVALGDVVVGVAQARRPRNLIRTSCAFGSSSCSSASSQPRCGPRAMAARVVMVIVHSSAFERRVNVMAPTDVLWSSVDVDS